MARLKKNNETEPVNAFRFSLIGLLLFSLVLIAGTGLVASRLFDAKSKPYSFAKNDVPDPDTQDNNMFTRKGPWGELLTQNIKLERPAEYIALDEKTPEPETWTFNGMTLDQVKALLTANGLAKEDVAAQLTPNRIGSLNNAIVFTPDENFLLSLKTETRQKLYGLFMALGQACISIIRSFSPKTVWKRFTPTTA